MALDESLLVHAALKKSPPTLRLYSWDVPTLSLGYSQPIRDVDPKAIQVTGWGYVRRPTGGKAILHTDELTYSITSSVDEGLMAGSLLESYQRVSGALQKALLLLGVNVTADSKYTIPEEVRPSDPVCFKIPSDYEITWNHKKLIGSAQSRKSGGVLQHGTLPLCGDLTRITRVLSYSSEAERERAKQNIQNYAATLLEATGRNISWQEASEAFVAGFSSQTNLELVEAEPSADELKMAKELMETKYSTTTWNQRI